VKSLIFNTFLIGLALFQTAESSIVTVSAIAYGIADSEGASLPDGTPYGVGYFTSDGTPGGTVLTKEQIAALSTAAHFDYTFVRYGAGYVGGENVLNLPGLISEIINGTSEPSFIGRTLHIYFNTGTEVGIFTGNGSTMNFPTDSLPDDQVNYDFHPGSVTTADIIFGSQGTGTTNFPGVGMQPNYNLRKLPAPPANAMSPITNIQFTPSGITLTKRYNAGQTQIAQYSPDLSIDSWIDIGNFISSGVNATFTDTTRRNQPAGYYRAILK
jgi:hypothetical protein